MLLGCDTSDSTTPATADKVSVDVALCVSPTLSSTASTRQSATVVQGESNFRGIQDIEGDGQLLTLIPLRQDGTTYDFIYPTLNRKSTTYYHYLSTGLTEMHIGTERFLCYGKATPQTGSNKFENGSIQPTLSDKLPANISFSLEPICDDEDDSGYEVAQAMADYLTAIATAGSTADDHWNMMHGNKLAELFELFTNDGNPIAGSTANVKAWVKLIQEKVANLQPSDTQSEILAQIGDVDHQAVFATPYPANIYLPDGAAAMMWHKAEQKFIVVKSLDDGAPLSDHSRFTYPAELYYFKESSLKTSTTSQAAVYDNAGNSTWKQITNHYGDGGIVTSATRSVAIEDAVDYGVCLLEAHITADAEPGTSETAILKDNNSSLKDQAHPDDQDIEFTASSFPLTGIIIDGQYQQQYDFTPIDLDTDDDEEPEEYIIYDTQVPTGDDAIHLWTSDAEKEKSIHTLVLQTRDSKPVDIVLEFVNNSGRDFVGAEGGTVCNGTKFYLIGQAKPSTNATDSDLQRRVFTKDHKTILNLTVNSLKNAYNVIPNLKTALYAIRVADVAVKQWTDNGYQNHDLYNW